MNSPQTSRYWLNQVVPVEKSDVAVLYWTTDIPSAEIVEAFLPGGRANQLPGIVGRAFSPFVCDECEEPVSVDSRTTAQALFTYRRKLAKSFAPLRRHYPLLCGRCAKAERERIAAPYREEMRRREARERELRTMPYREYLQTPEWAERRNGALRRAHYRCQTCAEGGQLHVHHRTYVRRGAEYASDLIVLCADCHRVFHERRSLADGGRAVA